MKGHTFIGVGIVLLLSGCGGGHVPINNNPPFLGTWKLQKVTGGFTGSGREVKVGERLELTDTTATYWVNGKVEWQRSYELQTKKEGDRTFSVIAFRPADSTIDWEIVEKTSTKLFLSDYNISDGFQYEFSAP
jgi:hypothetical protein